MPGRIKSHHPAHNYPHAHQHLKPRPHLSLLRRQDPNAPPAPQPVPTPDPATALPNQDNPSGGGSLFENNAPDTKGFVLNKQTIIWLVVISTIVLATLITVTCLLCKCKRRRKGKDGVKRHPDGRRWHPSLEVKDGRNDFPAWNRNAPPRASLAEQGGLRGDADVVMMETWESNDSMAPLRPNAAVVSGGNGNAVMEPVVVDYAAQDGKKSSRYYSDLNAGRERTSFWKRISQIGRAY